MHVIPMWQPHASAVALGLKKIETRGPRGNIKYRGPVAIHAAKKWDREIRDICAGIGTEIMGRIGTQNAKLYGKFDLPVGEIIAVADLIDCALMIECDFCDGCGWYEGGCVLKTDCPHCAGAGSRPAGYKLTPLERALGTFEAGRYGWALENVRPLREPLSYKAHQGVYLLPNAIADEVLRRAA